MKNERVFELWLVLAVSFGWIMTGVMTASADNADSFFDDSYVHEIRIYFENADWYTILYNSHANDPDDPYFPARFEYGDIVLDPVGVRFKGNSSFGINSVKKSFKIDFNVYNDSTVFLDLKKLNLNNGFKDPTLLREKLFLDFARNFVPTMRVVHTNLYVNDVLWGLYSAVEQVDKTFCQKWFGSNEDGNLFKGAASDDAGPQGDFGSDLTWLGADPEPYYERYQLKTNEEENDYSQLIEFINILNNSSVADLPGLLEPVFDVTNALMGLALNNLFVNLDSYNGSAHNYYVYDRDDTGQITHIHWDTNETFGRFLMFVLPGDDPLEMDPFWLPSPMGPPPQEEQERPLMENLWAVDAYSQEYLRDLAQMLRSGFDTATMESRITELANIIRTDVYADSNKMYSNAQFEQNLFSNIQSGPETIYGLRYFVALRSDYLHDRLDDFAVLNDVHLNEIMTINTQTMQDESGDYDPWIELYNMGPGNLNLSGLSLTDDTGNPVKWNLPSVDLEDGAYQVLWLDNEPTEGATHATFTLNPAGGTLYLYLNGTEIIDTVTYPGLISDNTFARLPDGNGPWETTNQPSPGTVNLPDSEPVVLFINELMADNDNTIEDPDEPGAFEDWFEIYNPGDTAVDLSGMYLTDDFTEPTQFMIPEGVMVPSMGYLVFWADDDTDQGSTHTNFKLSVSGEQIGLFDIDAHGNQQVDSITFGEQSTDVAFGRCPDGADTWEIFDYASPGGPNCQTVPTATPSTPTATPAVTPTPVVTPALKINEFMADNSTTLADNYGEYDDWMEIYNAGTETVDLTGMYLTDDPAQPTQWQIPAGFLLPPGGYLLIWCDNDTEQGDNHANFKLSASGEFVGLYDTDAQSNALIDLIEFDEQTTDVSMGRCPDGGSLWQFFIVPSPESSNGDACITPTPIPTATPEPCINDGDVNGTGSLTPEDALMAFQIYLSLIPDPTAEEYCAGDCNGNAAVTPEDALCIFQHFLSGACDCADPLRE